jgi:hypothetical protein
MSSSCKVEEYSDMSSTTISLFRQHIENQRQEPQRPQARSEPIDKPNLVAEMSRIEHEVRQLFDGASAAERDNIMRFLEVLIRNLKRRRGNE